MRKTAAFLLCFMLLLVCPVAASAQGTPGGGIDATIYASVPDSHWITVKAEHAQVTLDGQGGAQLKAARLSEPRLLIRPENGYRVTRVTLNGTDVTDAVIGGYYTLAPVYEDKTLTVSTEAVQQETDDTHDISGTIVDESGNPVPGVTVDIGGHTGVTDEDGHFTVEDVPDGRHPVTIIGPDGEILGYTEIEIVDGQIGVTEGEDGSFTITSPTDAALDLEMTITSDGRIQIGKVTDVTPAVPGSDIPKTGRVGGAAAVCILLPAAVCVLAVRLARAKGKRRSA